MIAPRKQSRKGCQNVAGCSLAYLNPTSCGLALQAAVQDFDGNAASMHEGADWFKFPGNAGNCSACGMPGHDYKGRGSACVLTSAMPHVILQTHKLGLVLQL
ncbi:TPA: hypothetical protein ACH3X2_008351 [Trebouxia sp. C0005]